MPYLIKDILVFEEDRPSEEVLDDTEVQDLITDGHTDPWLCLGGRQHGQHGEKSLWQAELIQWKAHLLRSQSVPARVPVWRGDRGTTSSASYSQLPSLLPEQ